MHTYSVKVVAEVGAMTVGGVLALLGVAESAPTAAAAIVAVFGFAGLLVRQIMQGQKAVWQIVAHKDLELESKDRQLAKKDYEIAYAEWERETLRYSYGERATPPGPEPKPPELP